MNILKHQKNIKIGIIVALLLVVIAGLIGLPTAKEEVGTHLSIGGNNIYNSSILIYMTSIVSVFIVAMNIFYSFKSKQPKIIKRTFVVFNIVLLVLLVIYTYILDLSTAEDHVFILFDNSKPIILFFILFGVILLEYVYNRYDENIVVYNTLRIYVMFYMITLLFQYIKLTDFGLYMSLLVMIILSIVYYLEVLSIPMPKKKKIRKYNNL